MIACFWIYMHHLPAQHNISIIITFTTVYSKTLEFDHSHSFENMHLSSFSVFVCLFVFNTNVLLCNVLLVHVPLLSAGAQALDPGGSRRLPLCGRRRHRPGDLRVRLGDTGAKPNPVRVVWQHSVWTSAPRRRGQAEGTAQHVGELNDG